MTERAGSMAKQESSSSGGFFGVFHEERLIQLGAAFLIAHSGAGFLESLIEDLLMPILFPLFREGAWETDVLVMGSVKLMWGKALASLIHFACVIIVVMTILHHIKKVK